MTFRLVSHLLVKHGIVDPLALDDPEGYDNYTTFGNVVALTDAINAEIGSEQNSDKFSLENKPLATT